MAAWEVIDYQTDGGAFPVRRFIEGLTAEEKSAALALIKILQERGNALRRPHSGTLGENLFELRDVPTGVRIFYTFLPRKRAVLLSGMIKKRGDIPKATLKEARRLCASARARQA